MDEQEAVSRALARTALIDTLEAQVSIEEGPRRAVSAYPNREIAYMREQTFGFAGTREDYLSVSQTIDLGNRLGFRADAADANVRAVRKEAEHQRHELAAQVRVRFYQVLHEQERVNSLESWTARIDEALHIVSRREASGDAATYDRRRLEREHAVAEGRLETERANLEGARARLAAIMGPDTQVFVVTGAESATRTLALLGVACLFVAVVILCCLASSTALNMFVVPALYRRFGALVRPAAQTALTPAGDAL